MKKKRITYGVDGMMEYQAIITVGKAKMKVHFSDGFVTAMGITPATFTTDNLIVQRAIEQSSDYKRGRIKVIRVTTLDEDVRIERNPAKESTDIHTGLSTDSGTGTASESNIATNDASSNENASETTEPGNECKTTEVNTYTQIEVSCNDDAKDYLEEHFGVIRSKLRVRADIQASAAAHGIEFVFK